MVQSQLVFKCRPEMQKARDYRKIQKSVNLLFSILEEYGRLGKNLAEIKNSNSVKVYKR